MIAEEAVRFENCCFNR